ncbi:hypothetical protein [uncultured Jannaschia sp.]|uniref:spike base protein, RCAP_Rcc01079 family n=1 Tax=uncultured Jannaschia sp. TaxID=293347 RepID=UPI002620F6E1|nr:hypothetical protein [uncultured Jannaschia sp.]
MNDVFADFSGGLESPATYVQTITPSDEADLPRASRALNVAVDGSIRITTVSGTTGTIYVAAGITFPVRVTRVWATGTTATGISVLS